jgi:hypothetical protein
MSDMVNFFYDIFLLDEIKIVTLWSINVFML